MAAFGDPVARWAEVADDKSARLLALVGDEFDRVLAPAPLPIAEAVLRRPIVVTGRIVETVVVERSGCRSLVARLEDGTGAVELVFLGRPRLPGVEVGGLMAAGGVIGRDRGRLRILNPLITLYAPGDGEH